MAAGQVPQESAKPARWFCRIDGKEVGPVTDKELRQLAGTGKLVQSAHVRLGDSGTWVLAAKVKGLFAVESERRELKDIGEQRDPLADGGACSVATVDNISTKHVPYLQFARPATDAPQSSENLVGAASTESRKSPPPRSVYMPQAAETHEAKPNSKDANAGGRTKNKKLLWIAAGGGGLALLLLIGVSVVLMTGRDEDEVAVIAARSESPIGVDEPNALVPNVSESVALRSSETETESLALNPFAEPAASEPVHIDRSEDVSPAPTDATDALLPPTAENLTPPPPVAMAEATVPPDTGNAPNATSTVMEESRVEAPVSDADEMATKPNPSVPVADVASKPSVGDDRRQEEASEAAKLVNEIDSDVQQRLQQIVEREALGKQMEANRAEYQRVLAALNIATNDLPRMERQYGALQDRRRDAIARMSSERAYIQIEANLAREMATMAQQIAQVTSLGNAALGAKPGLEQQWGEQNKLLAGLEQREGALHLELMAELDPYGLRSRRYRELLLDKASGWGAACVEAMLIRGLAQMHEGQSQRAVEDYSNTLSKLASVFRQNRKAKDSPELRVVQIALAARGLALFKLGKEPEAISDLGKAIGANGLYTIPLVFRGIIEAERGRHDAALRDFEAARRLNDPHATRETARLLATSPSHGSPTRALTLAKEACDLETSWTNQEVLGVAFAANGQNVLAREAYREAASQSPVDQAERILAAAASLPE